jgi:hypothetical protein
MNSCPKGSRPDDPDRDAHPQAAGQEAGKHGPRPAFLDYQQVGAQQLRVQRRREREPKNAAFTGSVALAGYRGRRS